MYTQSEADQARKPQQGLGTTPLRAGQKSPVDQIPSSTPVGWKGGTGPRESSTEFSRGLSNTAAALAPIGGPVVAGVLKGAAKLATGAASPIVQGVLAPTVPLAAGVSLLNAADADSRGPAAQINGSSVAATPNPAVPRSRGSVPGPATGGVATAGDQAPGLGMVNVRRQPNGVMEFSGENISGPVSYTGAQQAGFRPSGAGVSVVPGMAKEEIAQILSRPLDPRTAMTAEQRFQYDKEVQNAQGVNNFNAGINSRGTTVSDLLRSGMERRALANENARGEIASRQQQDQSRSAADTLAQRRQDESESNSRVTRRTGEVEAQGAEQIQALRTQLLEAETPEERNSVAKKLQALSGKETQNRYTTIAGGSSIDPATGAVLQRPGMVLDNSTGRLVDLGSQQGGQPEQSPYPDGTRLTGKDGKVYTVKNGQPVLETE